MTTPTGFDRRHAVTAAQEKAWAGQTPPPLTEQPPALGTRVLRRARIGLNNQSVWVPNTTPKYAAILDHGIRAATHGIVIHVNDGYAKGTEGFFTNGLPEPYGSQGVGAHFEISGRPGLGIYGDVGSVQFLPLDRVAWHNAGGNGTTIGIEHAGFGYSTAEWQKVHYNQIGNSAYRAAWILRRFNLGPPKISLTNINTGNVWPHNAGGANWGGHICPASTQNGVDYFPWQLWLDYCNRAYSTRWMWA